MKQWPKVGSKVKFKGTHMFWFTNMIEDANKLLEVDKEYTISKLELASSWCAVILEEFPEHKFSLSFFDYVEELTTEEVSKTNMKTQEELFNDIILLAQKVDNLKGYVQNDFYRMIADGTVTKEDILDSIDDIEINFVEVISELTCMKSNVLEHVKKIAEELN